MFIKRLKTLGRTLSGTGSRFHPVVDEINDYHRDRQRRACPTPALESYEALLQRVESLTERVARLESQTKGLRTGRIFRKRGGARPCQRLQAALRSLLGA